ncbi:MAG TPA: zf-HC2 domain-containing protein [Gemmatimonadales bacterium]|jgi:anti-sigma factor (TIGR02949 family)|nr:zf-HC2 domain-containing protein [Gemmatimonadales bacterium]
MGDSINCREAHARLHDFLKRELTPELAAEVEAHLEHCRPCFREAAFEERFLLMLREKAAGTCCPDRVKARIVAALHAEFQAEDG